MITFLFYYFLPSLVFLFTLKFFLQNRKLKNIPPGPPSLPLLGNLHQLSKPLHQAFHRISQRHGQVISLWFGSRSPRGRCLVTFYNPRMLHQKRHQIGPALLSVRGTGEMTMKLGIIKELVPLGGANNPADFMPILRWLNYDHLESKLKSFAKRVDGFLQGLIDEHRNEKQRANTMIDHLLSLQESQPEYYTDQIIKGLILVMLLAGTDTSALTLEWAMSCLLNNPHVLEKAKKEIDSQNIMSETLRLHLAAPLLVPREASNDCTIAGYNVPCGTMVLVNAWVIHKDPQLWSDATSFKLERFEKEGEANKLIPFGLGRRACPGSGLAQQTVGMTLGLLIQCFEWKQVSEEEIHMTEGARLTM
ncbi:hypothetical protein K1719_000881 [Acacia pycnantha]|nr:hypothetical protein K1719_000881 [Acacia pycnantha]